MNQDEIERVFLVKKLPEEIEKAKSIMIRVGDFFDSNRVDALKLKQKGDDYFLVKKDNLNGCGCENHEQPSGNGMNGSALCRTEHVIYIKKGEFEALWKATAQNHEKIRFLYPLDGRICEIDFYMGRLNGYVRAEVEFPSQEEADRFIPPDWFSDEITKYNHEIHSELGLVLFREMKERYAEKGIKLKRIKLPKCLWRNS